MNIILGNIVSLMGCTVMVLIGFIKNKDRYIAMQTLQFGLNAVSHLLLGGIGGAIASCKRFAQHHYREMEMHSAHKNNSHRSADFSFGSYYHGKPHNMAAAYRSRNVHLVYRYKGRNVVQMGNHNHPYNVGGLRYLPPQLCFRLVQRVYGNFQRSKHVENS